MMFVAYKFDESFKKYAFTREYDFDWYTFVIQRAAVNGEWEEVLAWCVEHAEEGAYDIAPGIVFLRDDDAAFFFKMRWC